MNLNELERASAIATSKSPPASRLRRRGFFMAFFDGSRMFAFDTHRAFIRNPPTFWRYPDPPRFHRGSPSPPVTVPNRLKNEV
jgi:hypothetical protein